MRIGWKTLALLLVAALVAVPAAGAKRGQGHGGGKPSWAGSGQGKPEWAGKGHEKKAKHAESTAANADDQGLKGKLKGLELDELTPEDLEDLNPAWTCKVERLLMEAESFAGEYATNENEANAFGKCVSEEAHQRDGVSAQAVEAFCGPSEEATAEEATTEEEATQEETTEGDVVDEETTEQETTPVETTPEDTTEGEEEAVVEEEVTDEAAEPALCTGGASGAAEGSVDGSEGAEGETSETDDPVLAALRSLF